MITYLFVFINDLRSSNDEVILLIDANEAFISRECGIFKLTKQTYITDPIFNKHGINLESNTYKGVS